MKIEVERIQRVLVIRLEGELDHHTATKVRTEIEREWAKGIDSHLVLNLEGVHFMDSSGLGVILGRYKRVIESGGKMMLSNVPKSIQKLMDMSGIFKILELFDYESQAISACEVAS
jgi:stage II sporulation protein AA (anti-sigma F factor antagonist)